MGDQRLEYGKELVRLGGENKDIIVLEADLGKSTMSYMFCDAYPDRYFEMGIAEQNMASFAAGLAISGKTVFINSFAVFAAGRAYDQIRQGISIGSLNVKIVGSSCGFSDAGDGATHQSIEDMAIMSAIPNMMVLSPCDAIEAKSMISAVCDIKGPVYLRLSRSNTDDIYDDSFEYDIDNIDIIKDGKDVVIFATGIMVQKALLAWEMLFKDNISAKVVNVSRIKPLDNDEIIKLAKNAKCVITCEEHSYIGGLSGAVLNALRKEKISIDYVAVEDKFGQSAKTHDELLYHYGLTAENIVSKAKSLLGGGV